MKKFIQIKSISYIYILFAKILIVEPFSIAWPLNNLISFSIFLLKVIFQILSCLFSLP